MAGGMKSLAKDTAIYGLSSILGKFIGWCLVPIYTRVLTTGEFGVMTNVYAYTALLAVILTYGMETGFFRFMNKGDDEPMKVYSTTLLSIALTSILFVVFCFSFLNPIADFLDYSHHPDYIAIMAIVVGIDTIMTIPFAYLRYKKRPIRFATLRLSSIFITIAFTIFFLIICPKIHAVNPSLIAWFYNPSYKEGYVFVANLIGSAITFIFLIPELRGFKYVIDIDLLKRMLKYCFPLLILGIAGMLNQTVDKIIYPYLFDDKVEAFRQLGIYSACSRVAIIMMMFTQAFRFAYEPFIFAKNKDANHDKAYTEAMKYFIIFSLIIFLGVMFYMDIIKHFIGKDFYEGLNVVSIVMMGYILFGVYFNLSFWYKMVDKTYFGAVFSIAGCVITIVLNIVFVPIYGYIASAWATLICNLIMMLLSYYFERKYRPLPYDFKSIGLYFGLAIVLYGVSCYIWFDSEALRLAFNTVLLAIFFFVLIKRDLPLSEIPVIGKMVKRK